MGEISSYLDLRQEPRGTAAIALRAARVDWSILVIGVSLSE